MSRTNKRQKTDKERKSENPSHKGRRSFRQKVHKGEIDELLLEESFEPMPKRPRRK